MGENRTVNTCIDTMYSGIAPYYDKWSSGDWAWDASRKFYRQLLMDEPGMEIMELGIGSGSISLPVLCQRHIHITGVDISDGMLNICSSSYAALLQTGKVRGQLVLRRQDMCDLTEQQQYNCVILPFRTVGHLLHDKQLEKLFFGVWRSLRPGGCFVLDHYMFNRQWAEAHNHRKIVMYSRYGTEICDCYHYNFAKGTLRCQVFVNDVCAEEFDFRWMEPDLIRNYAVAAGFRVEKLLGDYDGSLWTADASEQIWILRK